MFLDALGQGQSQRGRMTATVAGVDGLIVMYSFLPSCLRKALVYDHKNPRVSNISDLTSWAGWSSLEGRHSLFTAFSRLRGSRSLRESPFSCFHCFLGVLGLEILTLHVWLKWVLGIQTCGLLKLVQALLFTEPGGFLLKGCLVDYGSHFCSYKGQHLTFLCG